MEAKCWLASGGGLVCRGPRTRVGGTGARGPESIRVEVGTCLSRHETADAEREERERASPLRLELGRLLKVETSDTRQSFAVDHESRRERWDRSQLASVRKR